MTKQRSYASVTFAYDEYTMPLRCPNHSFRASSPGDYAIIVRIYRHRAERLLMGRKESNQTKQTGIVASTILFNSAQ